MPPERKRGNNEKSFYCGPPNTTGPVPMVMGGFEVGDDDERVPK